MNPVRIGVIGGTRGMGRWFARFFRRQGHIVAVCDERTRRTPAMLAESCDVVVVAVPIGVTQAVIEAVGPLVRRRGLLMDLTSLKAGPVAAMLRHSRSAVVGCHPLFGPQTRSLRGRSVVLCPARKGRWLPWLRSMLEAAGARVVLTTPRQHDRRMALVQGLNHLNSLALGMILSRSDTGLADLAAFSTPAFEQKLRLAARVFRSNPRLHADILALNPDMARIAAVYEKTLGELKTLIRNRDAHGLNALMARHAARLWPAG